MDQEPEIQNLCDSSMDLFEEECLDEGDPERTNEDNIQNCHQTFQEENNVIDLTNKSVFSDVAENLSRESGSLSSMAEDEVYHNNNRLSSSEEHAGWRPREDSECVSNNSSTGGNNDNEMKHIVIDSSDEEETVRCSQPTAISSKSTTADACDMNIVATCSTPGVSDDQNYKQQNQVPGHDTPKRARQSDDEDASDSERSHETRAKNSDLTRSDYLICPFCQTYEISLYRLELHIATMHPDGDIREDVTKSLGENTDLGAASITEDAMTFSCPLCDLDVPSEDKLQDHLSKFHPEVVDAGASLPCPLCEFTCEQEDDLRRHVQSHDSDRTYFGVSPSEDAESSSNSGATCPICAQVFADTDLLTSHVEFHFNTTCSSEAHSSSSENSDGPYHSKSADNVLKDHQHCENVKPKFTKSLPSAKPKVNGRGVYDKQYERNVEQAVVRGEMSVAEYHEQRARSSHRATRDVDDGETRVQGLVDKVQRLFASQARSGQAVYLCSPTDHFSGSYGDKGWGCGYRNFQMMLSCLLQNSNFADKIYPDGRRDIPSIPKIQQMIESAWKKGFDPQGCEQLKGRLSNTRKWIGATEIVALLSSLRIKCHLADFHAPSGTDGTHPRLLEWISSYFSDSRGFKPPLYLQHQGHSRTVIGVEKDRDVTKLLLFDPGASTAKMAAIAQAPMTWKQMRTFRGTQAAFKSRQYQVVAVIGLLSEAEYQQSKILKSERVV